MKLGRLKTYLPHLLSLAALILFISYLYHNADRYSRLLTFSVGSLFLLLGLVLAVLLGNGAVNYFLYRGLGARLTLNESVGLAAVNTLANLLPFAGGMIAKGVYLKRRYRLAYTHYLSATLALYVCFVAVNGGIGVAILAYLSLVRNTAVPALLILGFAGMAASVSLLGLPLGSALSVVPGKWGRRFAQLIEGWQVLSQNRLLIGQLVGVQILMMLMLAGRFWIAFHALSQDVTLVQCILFASATILTRLVTITPGGLGAREGIVAGVAAVLGFDAGVSVVAVGIDRLVTTGVIIALGTMYTYVLSGSIATAQASQRSTTQGGQETA